MQEVARRRPFRLRGIVTTTYFTGVIP
jgi:hypothetical protein